MIHNPYITDLKGDSHELRNVANQLDKIKALLIDVSARRAARNGKSISNDELISLYDNETWLTSEETKNKYGFVDEVVDAIKAVAKINLNDFKMEQKDNWLKATIKALFGGRKFKNDFTETLQDGTVVVVVSEDGDWTNKPIMTESGDPLPPGDYTLASGKVITVGDGSTISAVKDAPAAAAETKETPEDMSKIKELEEQLAAAKTSQAAAEAKVAELATASAKQSAAIEARFKALEDAKKAEEGKTVGEKFTPGRGPILALGGEMEEDPMGEDALEYLRSRNLVKA